MSEGMNTILYPVSDLERAAVVFGRLLGVAPTADSPYYVGFQVGGLQVGLDPNGSARGMTGATPFWDVDDIKAKIALLIDAGARIVEDVHEVGNGLQVAILADPEGSMIGLRQGP